MIKLKTYKGKHYLGALGDFTAEWWDDTDWAKHHEYVKELKASGEYLKEVDYTITLVHNKELDEPCINSKMTVRFEILKL